MYNFACVLIHVCQPLSTHVHHRPPKEDDTNTNDPASGDPPSLNLQMMCCHKFLAIIPHYLKPDNVLPQTPIGWTSLRTPGCTTSTPGSTTTPAKDNHSLNYCMYV